jgi:tripeptidyl-peptidase-1
VLVSQANQLLGASYRLYHNANTNDTIIHTVGYALPAVLHKHIQAVAPTTYFAPTRVMRQTPRRRSFREALARPASGKFVTARTSPGLLALKPSTLRWLYNLQGYTPAATDRNRLGVVGFGGEYPNPEDLTRFSNDFDTASVGATFTVEQVNGGGYNQNDPGEQANTDVQYAGTMGYPTPLIFYSTGGEPVPGPGDGVLELLNYLIDRPNIPQTISISYAFGSETRVPKDHAAILCNKFARLGALGVSVLVASGNHGVGEGDCHDDSGNVWFIAEFPSSCTCGVLSALSSTTQTQVAH